MTRRKAENRWIKQVRNEKQASWPTMSVEHEARLDAAANKEYERNRRYNERRATVAAAKQEAGNSSEPSKVLTGLADAINYAKGDASLCTLHVVFDHSSSQAE